MHVPERLVGQVAHCMLPHPGKQTITQLIEAHIHHARDTIGGHEHDRDAEPADHANTIGRRRVRQGIGRPFEEVGRQNVDKLARNRAARANATRRLRSARSEGQI